MTSRERFHATVSFGQPDVPFIRPIGGWPQTVERWKREGWDGRPIHEIFGADDYEMAGVNYGPQPPFEREVIEEDDRVRIVRDEEGVLLRELKNNTETSMPQFLKFPVENREDFRRLRKERLRLSYTDRVPSDWEQKMSRWPNRTYPVMCKTGRHGGFFGPLREFMGLEGLCLAFHDDLVLIEKMMEDRADAVIDITGEVLKETSFDVIMLWEDMAYKTGSLVDPRLFR